MPTPDATPRPLERPSADASAATARPVPPTPGSPAPVREVGGRVGPEPTRYGDWEKSGRCIDF